MLTTERLEANGSFYNMRCDVYKKMGGVQGGYCPCPF
uniref:Uncharacterized protein n=1 Tax=Anguilla anguilla TaxID=7936 RepID=A0A0E9WDA2_ANGAN